MGDLITGGGINEGNGVYKSTDAGNDVAAPRTRRHQADPVDPRRSERSEPRDGRRAGKHPHAHATRAACSAAPTAARPGTKTLYRRQHDRRAGDRVGVRQSERDARDDGAALHRSRRARGRGGGGRWWRAAGSDGTTLFKSTDEGLTWKEITGNGLPPLAGRTSIAVAMNTNSQRMFLIGNFGLYRSDDGGDDVAADGGERSPHSRTDRTATTAASTSIRRIPTSSTRSTRRASSRPMAATRSPASRARRAATIRSRCGSIRPTASACSSASTRARPISLDGGQTWSSWYNQATEQVYHISVDNSYPYWVYATQQDAGSIATRSRGDLGEITPLDWYPDARIRVRLDRRRSAQSEDRLRRRARRRHREDHVSERAVDQRQPEHRHEPGAAKSRQPADRAGRRRIRTNCSSASST